MIKPEINKIPDYHYDQYNQPCQECGTILQEDVAIEIWESKTNPVEDTICVCDDCSQTYANEYKKDGYISQGELDEIQNIQEIEVSDNA